MHSLSVDGPRPGVGALAALPPSYRLTDAERLVLFALACDSFDGETSAPGWDALCRWTGLTKGRAVMAVSELSKPHAHRPALLAKHSTRGRNRTVYRLVLQPVGQPDQSASATGSVREQVREPVRELVGKPVGQPDQPPPLPLPSNPPTPHNEPAPAHPATDRTAWMDDLDGIPDRYWAWINDRRPHPHQHEYNARKKLARMHAERNLPLEPNELLERAIRLGDGNPWAGALMIGERSASKLDGARDPVRVLRARLGADPTFEERTAFLNPARI